MYVEGASRWAGRGLKVSGWLARAGALSLLVGCGDLDLHALLSAWGNGGHGAGGAAPGPVWSEPEQLTSDGDTPELALDSGGIAVAAWQVPARQVGARVALAELGPEGAAWREVSVSGTSGGPYSTPHRVVAGDDGSFELLWHNTGFYASVYRPGVGLGVAQRSNERGGNPDGDGAIAGGNTWLASNPFGWVVLSHTSDGVSWTRMSGLFLDQFSESDPAIAGPRLVPWGSGAVRLFWAQRTGLYVSTFSGGAPADWSAPRAIVDGDPAVAGGFVAAGSVLGHALIAWEAVERAVDGGAVQRRAVQLMELAPDGSADGARPARLDTAANVVSPALAMSPAGDALLSWVESEGDAPADAGSPGRVWAALRAADASSWSAAVPLSSAGAAARAPVVAFGSGGDGHVAWLEVAAGDAQLFAVRGSLSSGFGAASLVSGAAAPAAEARSPGHADPRIVADALGGAIALWVGADGGVWSARLE